MKKIVWKALHNKTHMFLAVCFLLGLFLRLYPAFIKPFWEDELATFAFAKAPYSWLQQLIWPMDDRPPVFYLLVRLLTKITTNEFLLRLPFVLLASSISLIYYYGFKNISKHVAYIIFFLFTFSLVRVEYAWQLRDYSILGAVTAFSILLLLRYYDDLSNRSVINFSLLQRLSLLFLLGCLTNYIFVVFCLSTLTYIVYFTYRKQFKNNVKKIIPFVSKIVLYQMPTVLLLGLYLNRQFAIIKNTTEWIAKPNIASYFALNSILLGFDNNFYDLYQTTTKYIIHHVFINITLVAIFLFAIYIFSLKEYRRYKQLKEIFYMGLGIYISGFLVMLLIENILHINIFLVRTFMRLGAFLLISFGIAIYTIMTYLVKRKYIYVSICAILSLLFVIFAIEYNDWYEPNAKDLSTGIQLQPELTKLYEIYKPGDQIIYFPLHYQALYPLYYWRNKPDNLKSLALYQQLFGNETALFSSYQHQLLNNDLSHIANMPKENDYGKIIVLDWTYKSPPSWKKTKVLDFCRDNKNGTFSAVLEKHDVVVSVCK